MHLLAFAVMVIALTLVSVWFAREREKRSAHELAAVTASSVAQSMATRHAAVTAALMRMGTSLEGRVAATDCVALKQSLLDPEKLIEHIGIVGRDGRWLCTSVGTRLPPVDLSAFRSLRLAFEGGITTAGRPQLSAVTGRWLIPYSAPIPSAGGNAEYLLCASVDLERQSKLLKQQLGGRDGLTAVVSDGDGRIVARSPINSALFGRRTPLAALADKRQRGTGHGRTLDGGTAIWAWERIPSTGWIAFAGISDAIVAGRVRQEVQRDVAMALFLVIATALLAGNVTRVIATPFEAATRAVRAAGKGKAVEIDEQAPLEAVELMRALDDAIAATRRSDRLRADVEYRYQQIVESAQEGIWIAGNDNRTIFVNDYLTRLLGYTREEMLGRPVTDFLSPEFRPVVEAQMAKRKTGVSAQYDVLFLGKDGRKIWALVAGAPFRDSDGTIVGAMAVIADITERKKAEEEMEQARRALETQRDEIDKANAQLRAMSEQLVQQQEQERMRIARELHDNLGQLLTALKMDIGGLLASHDNSEERERYAGRVYTLTDQLLEDIQSLSSELRPVDIEFGLAAAIEHEARLFEERTAVETTVVAEPEVSIEPELSMTLFWILREALTNIARHAEARRVEIRLARAGDDALLSVTDDGVGIPPQAIGASGSLGLAIMGERAQAANIHLTVARAPSGGTMVAAQFTMKGRTHDPGPDRG